ncbi:MAG TPA: YezD family protein [Symbiobacteriaceae bacterium]
MPGTVETPPAARQKGLTAEERQVLQSVLTAIRRIRHGYVQIVLHEGRVVQIDRLEKERL